MKTRLIILFGLLAAVAAGLGAISTGPISGGTGPTGPAGANPPTVLRKAAVSKPLIGIANWMDYWYQTNLAYGNWMMGEPGEDVASNSVVFAKANKIEWLRIDRGWAATNRTAGGVVTVGASGKGEILDVKIDPQAVRPEDAEMLQDLLVVAANEALAKAREAVERAMKKVTGGAGLPGLF